jgi:hypothetical protein
MELLSVARARSIWLIHLQDINPRGKNVNAHIIEWLRDKYHFLKFPSSIYDRDTTNQSLMFNNGSFLGNDGSSVEIDLSFYNDGLIADTRASTKDSDIFLGDLLNSFVRDFDLVYKPEMIRKRLYVSELNLRLKQPLSNINSKMQAVVHKIISMIGDEDVKTLNFASLGFWWDPASASAQSHFQFERTLNVPFSEQRYYSRAPLQTEDHLQLLDEFEELLLG